jgi:hypothetical protein
VVPPYEIYQSDTGHDAHSVLNRNGISEQEVEEVLGSDNRLPVPMVADYGARIVAVFGHTRAGRALRIDIRMAAGFRRVVVGASAMTDVELAQYEKWVGDDER